MLNHIHQNPTSEAETLNSVNSFLSQPVPRRIPESMKKQVRSVLFKTGLDLTIKMTLQMLIFFPIIIILLPLKFIVTGAILPLFLITGIVLMIVGKQQRQQQLTILSHGTVLPAKITKVEMRNKTQKFILFKLHLLFHDQSGKEIALKENISADIIDKVYKTMNENGKKINILYFEKIPGKIILPLNLIYQNQLPAQ